jgi:hypothetical protein
MTFTAQQKSQILQEARSNMQRINYPPRHVTPPVESKTEKWKREAEELAAQREAAQLSDSIAARIAVNLRAEFDGKLNYQRQFVFDVVKGALEEFHSNLLDEIGQLRAEMTVADKVLNAKVIDLPNPLPARRTG